MPSLGTDESNRYENAYEKIDPVDVIGRAGRELEVSETTRSATVAAVYRSNIVRDDQPATAMSPCSDPLARNHLVAAVCLIRCGRKPTIPAASARAWSVRCSAA